MSTIFMAFLLCIVVAIFYALAGMWIACFIALGLALVNVVLGFRTHRRQREINRWFKP